MQTWDAITSRRNVRSFADRPIPAADLDRILEAGRRAPSPPHLPPWDFIVVTDRDQLRDLARVWRGAGHVAGSAATIAVIGPPGDNEFHRAQLDLGQATMAMLLAAADLGIGSCHAGVADLPLARRVLGFPDDRDCKYSAICAPVAGVAPVWDGDEVERRCDGSGPPRSTSLHRQGRLRAGGGGHDRGGARLRAVAVSSEIHGGRGAGLGRGLVARPGG